MITRLLAVTALITLSGCACVRHDPVDEEPLRVRKLPADASEWDQARVHFRSFEHNSMQPRMRERAAWDLRL